MISFYYICYDCVPIVVIQYSIYCVLSDMLSGDTMHITSSEFADDPCSSVKRSAMVRAARALLSAVTRLLILADMVDVYLLLKSLRAVSL